MRNPTSTAGLVVIIAVLLLLAIQAGWASRLSAAWRTLLWPPIRDAEGRVV